MNSNTPKVIEPRKAHCLFTIKTQLFLLVFGLLLFSNLQAQTISSTGSNISTCGNCAPTGWLDNGGTPDISDKNTTGGQGSLGGGATWVNAALPLPLTGDLTWIS